LFEIDTGVYSVSKIYMFINGRYKNDLLDNTYYFAGNLIVVIMDSG
tara:strand:+ start:688 stop:825 length:138 start_codon:yes stop_codon:yes gene_type:complete